MDNTGDSSWSGKLISLPHALDLLIAGTEVQERMGQGADLDRRLPDLLVAFHGVVEGLDGLRVDWRRVLGKDARMAVLIPIYDQWQQELREAAANVIDELKFSVFTSPFVRETKMVAEFFRMMERERKLVRLDVATARPRSRRRPSA